LLFTSTAVKPGAGLPILTASAVATSTSARLKHLQEFRSFMSTISLREP
jgi:hypothetical protein